MIAGLGALTFAIIQAPRAGWASARTLGVLAVALASTSSWANATARRTAARL